MTKTSFLVALRCVSVLMLAFSGAAAGNRVSAQTAPSFSAELVRRQDSTQDSTIVSSGRIDVLASKVRFETPELTDGYFIADVAMPSAYFVRPAARVYMDARRSTPLTRLFVPVNPADPCPQWQAMARLADASTHGSWRCAEKGEQMLDGRRVLTYSASSDDQEQFVAWIDPERSFPLQIKLSDGAVFTLRAIRDQTGDARDFDVPDGFRKFDPAVLLERVKQSDVWVEQH